MIANDLEQVEQFFCSCGNDWTV